MTELRTYEFGADAETLRRAGETGIYPGGMEPAFRAMISEILSRVYEKPRAIYLCSPDRDSEARDRFAYVLAKLLREHVPTVILVDCAFLSVGLSGIVPHRDALGFLDLLLYGTSLGVITQEAEGGVRVVGSGSFAVTKKSPFVMDSFAGARRYLANQARCAIFVGPATDDGDNLHPVAQNVDLVILLRTSDRPGGRVLDPYEEKVASAQGVEAWSVRINTRAAAAEPAAVPEAPRSPTKVETALVAEVEEFEEKIDETPVAPRGRALDIPVEKVERRPPVNGTSRAGAVPSPPIPPSRATSPLGGRRRSDELEELERLDSLRKAGGSRAVRVIASVVMLVVVAFVIWWFYITRPVRDRAQEEAAAGGPQSTAVPSAPGQGADSLSSGASPSGIARPGESGTQSPHAAAPDSTQRAEVGSAPPDQTGSPSGSATAPSPSQLAAAETPHRYFVSTADSIYSADALDEFADRYIIHVSSFRGREKAKEEAFYLLGWGYPVFMYHVDLGSKGMWYRVYVGPYDTREEAMQHKIKLDENPRIQSTRISKVPG